MLYLLRDNTDNNDIILTSEFFKDLQWFNTFSQIYNGVTMYDVTPLFEDIHLDASLTGLDVNLKSMCILYLHPKAIWATTLLIWKC